MTKRTLTVTQQKQLTTHEEVIERGLATFVEVGQSLQAIRSEKLYLEIDDTFEGYVRKRWDMSRQHAYRLIESAETVISMSPMGDIVPPKNERQVRVLLELDSEQDRATAWTRAVETAPVDKGGAPIVTARIVKQVVDEMGNGKSKRNPSQAAFEELKRGRSALGVVVRTLVSFGELGRFKSALEPVAEWLEDTKGKRLMADARETVGTEA